jgi:RNA polymerase primary sigma factor
MCPEEYDLRVTARSEDDPAETRTLQAYLREIARFPRLSPDEERALGTRIRRDGDEQALRRLVESNLRFVVSYARHYRGLGVPFLDLIHEGNLGLLEAAARFDPGRNVKFITYAVWWVRQAIMHALSEQTRAFSVPPKLSAIAARFSRQLAALTEVLGHAPSAAEIAEDLEISTGEADALMQIRGVDRSLSEPVGAGSEDGERELADLLPQQNVPPIEEELVRQAFIARIRAALADLDPKEREVIALRYGLADGESWTLQQIGDRLHLTRERIRQIESRAREKLRRSRKIGELMSRLN